MTQQGTVARWLAAQPRWMVASIAATALLVIGGGTALGASAVARGSVDNARATPAASESASPSGQDVLPPSHGSGFGHDGRGNVASGSPSPSDNCEDCDIGDEGGGSFDPNAPRVWVTPDDSQLTGAPSCTKPSNTFVADPWVQLSVGVDDTFTTTHSAYPGIGGVSLVPIDGLYEGDLVTWAPDSRHAVITDHRTNALWLVTVSGSQASAQRVGASLAIEVLSPVVWSRDGSEFAFLANPTKATQALVVADVATGSTTTVATAARIAGYDFRAGTQQVAYGASSITSRSRLSAEGSDVVIWDRSTGAEVARFAGAAFPSFSPDGTRVAVFGDPDRDGDAATHVFDVRSGSGVALTAGHTFDAYLQGYWDRFAAAWSPDGTRVAAVTSGTDNSRWTEVVVANADGSDATVIPQQSLVRPVWTADSATFATFSTGRVTSVSGTSATSVDMMAISPLVPHGSGFALTASPCGSVTLQSIQIDRSLTSVSAVDAPDGWLDLGVPLTAPNGRYALRMLAGPDSTNALYLITG